MALKSDFTFQGIPVTDGYIKVDQGRFINRDGEQKLEYILTYEKERDSGKVMQSVHCIDIDFSTGLEQKGYNPVVQAYTHAKTLPEFSSAIDIDQDGNPGT